jgi:hypothetical protein
MVTPRSNGPWSANRTLRRGGDPDQHLIARATKPLALSDIDRSGVLKQGFEDVILIEEREMQRPSPASPPALSCRWLAGLTQ